ncbi:MAG: O-antigen ligase family protein [Dehalococcoidia bacterium]
MSTASFDAATLPLRRVPFVGSLAMVVLLSGLAALLVALLGPKALMLGAGAAVVPVALLRPRETFWAAAGLAVVVDTAAVGSTSTLTLAFWELPSSVLALMPFKMNPFEIVIALSVAGVALQSARSGASLPPIARLVPLMLLLGMAVGIARGGAINLAYHEARGLLFGAMAFVVVWRTGGLESRPLARWFVGATAVLGLSVLCRFVVDLRGGAAGPPKEFWFGHETGLFLAAGALAGCLLLTRVRDHRGRALLALYVVLMVAATLMTGRRSAILVAGVGVIAVAWLVFPRRPALLTFGAFAAVALGGLYVNAFWDSQAGPIAEPARAVRSQVDPDPRDASSDAYRATERSNIQRTLSESPLLGLGFGRPFTEYEELPDLDFWPLQLYTPHQNLLWLWLKMGIAGAAILLGLWVLAFRRCLAACFRIRAGGGALPIEPIFFASALLMYLVYARIDLAVVASRASVPLAVLLALVLMRPWSKVEQEQ